MGEPLQNLLKAALDAEEIQSAVWLVSRRETIVAQGAVGLAGFDTRYDLASLTKPLVTALLLALCSERGWFTFDSRLGDRLPVLRESPYGRVSIVQAVTHTGGFPAWQPLYALCSTPDEVLSVIARMPPVAAPGEAVVYSDLGYIVLGKLLEQVTGQSLADSFESFVARPLGLTATRFCPPPDWRERAAPTEVGNAHEARMVEQLIAAGNFSDPSIPARLRAYAGWRTQHIQGEVHDGNAHFLGGVAGHAGLFATVEEVWKLAQVFLPGSCLLEPETCRWFATNLTPGKAEARSFGWMLACSPNATGVGLSPMAFGHLGFTGTSLWCDAESERVYVLLTNRTFPCRAGLQNMRRAFHAAASRISG
ncbi:MAG: serine hydrolase domain-containing protein [Acidobacteriota bacterium]